jgi:hypothetical protein
LTAIVIIAEVGRMASWLQIGPRAILFQSGILHFQSDNFNDTTNFILYYFTIRISLWIVSKNAVRKNNLNHSNGLFM